MEDKDILRFKIQELQSKKRQELLKFSDNKGNLAEKIRDINGKISDIHKRMNGR